MRTRWQNWITLIGGIWLFISPWVYNYSDTGHAWNSYLFGIAITVFSFWALSDRKIWEEWINMVIGIWLFISPWVLGFTEDMNAFWNMLIVSAIIVLMSIWDMSVQRRVEPV